MKKIGWVALLLACGWLLSSCTTSDTPAANSGNTAAVNSNANAAAKPAAAAPTADALLANDKTATEAWMKGDAATLGSVVSDKFISHGQGSWHGKSDMMTAVPKVKCDVKGGGLSEPQVTKIDDDNYALVYKNTYDATCTYDGKAMPQPKTARATTIWSRSGDKWLAVFHGENEIIDPKNPPKTASQKDQEPEKAPAPALPAKSANTDAVAAVEKSGWEAWRDKDAKKLDSIIAKNILRVGADGSMDNDRASILKYWTSDVCKDVKNVDVKDPYGITLGANTELLAFTGVADGTCDGQKNMPQPSVSIYVKEDGAWKLAYAYGGTD